jgi:hypothetical protein
MTETSFQYTARQRGSNGNGHLLDEIEQVRDIKKVVDGLIGALTYVSDGRHRRRRDEEVIDAIKRAISYLLYSAQEG